MEKLSKAQLTEELKAIRDALLYARCRSLLIMNATNDDQELRKKFEDLQAMIRQAHRATNALRKELGSLVDGLVEAEISQKELDKLVANLVN